jgi:hypothetical protein
VAECEARVGGWGGFIAAGGATVVLGAVVSANQQARADVSVGS